MNPTIETARLALRPWGAGDLAEFFKLFGDPAVMWWGPLGDEDQAKTMLERFVGINEGGHHALRVSLPRGPAFGNVMLHPARYADGIEIAYHFAPAHRGQGYATEAAAALCDWGLGKGGLSRIIAAVVPDNVASIRVLERLGFVPAGTVMHADRLHNLYERRATPRG